MKQSRPGKNGYPPKRVNFTGRLCNKLLSIFKTRVRSMPKTTKMFRFFANIAYDSLILKFLKLCSCLSN